MKLEQLRAALCCEHETRLVDVSYDAMAISDDAVAKALMISDVARIARIEVRLREYLLAKWNVRAKQAAKRGAEIIEAQGKLATVTSSALSAIDSAMRQWSRDVEARVKQEVRAIYKLARAAGTKKATGKTKASLYYTLIGIDKPTFKAKSKGKGKGKAKEKQDSFNLVDERAVADLEDDAMIWVGRHYDQNIRDTMRKTIGETVASGLGRVDAGKVLAGALTSVNVPNGFKGTAAQYFEGLAANVATNARVRGQLRSFKGVGVQVFEIINPMDDRTCQTCSQLNGMTFKVSDGLAQMKREAAAKNPDEVKRAHPWLSHAKISSIFSKGGKSGLVGAGVVLPPYHFRCRCTIDVAEESFDFDKLDFSDD